MSVCVRRARATSQIGSKSGARCSIERDNPNFSTGRRGFDVTATLLALLRHGCGVVSSVNRCSFFRTAFKCILAHCNAFIRICTHFCRAAF